ncbi:MAG: hypothetical protein AB1742_01275 [bacterium]
MTKKTLNAATLVFACILCLTAGAAFSQISTDSLPAEWQDLVDDMLATRYPPMLESVTTSPESPAGGEDVEITAVIQNDSSLTDDETVEAYVVYSADGGESWDEVELEQGGDDKTWTGTIPGQDSGTELIYAVRAIDTSENVYVEMVCDVDGENWPPDTDEDCVSTEDPSNCESNLPVNCLFPMSRDESPLDDEDSLVNEDLDFWDYRVGNDGENYYIDLAVQGEITSGTVSPMDVYGYVVLMINPDKGGAGGGLEELLDSGLLVLYAPHAEIAGGAAPIFPCMIGWKQGSSMATDRESISCDAAKNHLFLSFPIEKAFDNPSAYLTYLVLNGHITNISPLTGDIGNYSHWTNAKIADPGERTITFE